MADFAKTHFVDAGAMVERTLNPRKISIGGRLVKDKRPNGLSRQYVDVQGNVVHVQISDGSQLTGQSTSYREQVVAKAGYIKFGDCPLRSGDLKAREIPEELRTMCDDDTYGEHKACKHVEWVISERRAQHEEAERKSVAQTAIEIEREMREREIALTREGQRQTQVLLEKIAGAAAQPPKGPTK
jgi:hypothetical protein